MENGIDNEPRLRVWLQEYEAPRDKIDNRLGRWVSERSWPSDNVSAQDFWLGASGLTPSPSNDLVTAVVPWTLEVGTAAGETGYFGRVGVLPTCQRDDDARSLILETDPLEEPLEIMGSVRLAVSLETDQPLATLVARLNDVPPSGGIARVTYSIQNLALEVNGKRRRRFVPNEARSYDIHFPNIAYRFEKGHRIRLAVSSSYWPIIWPSPKPTKITLHLTNSRLTLPIRRAEEQDDVPISFSGSSNPDHSQTCFVISAPSVERRADIDAVNNFRMIRLQEPLKRLHFNKIDLEVGVETLVEHKITSNEPNSASTRCEHRLHLSRPNWTVEVISITELTSTENTYNPTGSIEVRENGEICFRRQWAPVISRICS